MSQPSSATIYDPSSRRLEGGAISSRDSQLYRYAPYSCDALSDREQTRPPNNRPPSPSIHILDDDSLLNIFCLYRPVLINEDEANVSNMLERGEWRRKHWWLKLAHVCRRWRTLVLASTSYLRIGLVCTYDSPVRDMLAPWPPLPLIMDYADNGHELTVEEVQRICLTLQYRDRIRRIRLSVHQAYLRNIVTAFIDKEFPMLECLIIKISDIHSWPLGLKLPDTLRAPRLRHLVLTNFIFPITSPLLTTTMHLVTLSLNFKFVGHCQPDDLLKRLALLPRLELLAIIFNLRVRDNGIEEQVSHTQFTTHVTLPNLRWFEFQGTSAYLEALLPGMSTPLLENFQLVMTLFGQLTSSIPSLLEFMNAAENFSPRSASFHFHGWGVDVRLYPCKKVMMSFSSIMVLCRVPGQQLSFVAQLSNVLSPVFSAVVDLTIYHYLPSTQHDEVNCTQWRKLLRSFRNVKTLHMANVFDEDLFRSLRSDGEPPLGPLPELKELVCPATGRAREALTAFITAREAEGRPVRLSTRYIRKNLPR
jgi:hypothetical protein